MIVFFSPEQEGEYDIPFDEAFASLQKEWAKSKPKQKTVRKFFNATLKQRHMWIQDTCPIVSDILERYPMLKKPRWVGVSQLYINLLL